jgi:hypothetical protein
MRRGLPTVVQSSFSLKPFHWHWGSPRRNAATFQLKISETQAAANEFGHYDYSWVGGQTRCLEEVEVSGSLDVVEVPGSLDP